MVDLPVLILVAGLLVYRLGLWFAVGFLLSRRMGFGLDGLLISLVWRNASLH